MRERPPEPRGVNKLSLVDHQSNRPIFVYARTSRLNRYLIGAASVREFPPINTLTRIYRRQTNIGLVSLYAPYALFFELESCAYYCCAIHNRRDRVVSVEGLGLEEKQE